MKKNYPVVFDQSAENFDEIYVSGGRVGLTLKVPLKDLLDVTQGKLAPITHGVSAYKTDKKTPLTACKGGSRGDFLLQKHGI